MRDLLLAISNLKNVPRTGWISHGVSLAEVESVADHSFSVCMLSLLLADLELRAGRRMNLAKVLQLAVVHDWSEALTFDINKTYLQYLGRPGEVMKKKIERSAWNNIAKKLGDAKLGSQYSRLHSEYQAEKSVESQVVHGADGLDILLQAIHYRKMGYSEAVVRELWDSTNRKLQRSRVPAVRTLRRILVSEAAGLGRRVRR